MSTPRDSTNHPFQGINLQNGSSLPVMSGQQNSFQFPVPPPRFFTPQPQPGPPQRPQAPQQDQQNVPQNMIPSSLLEWQWMQERKMQEQAEQWRKETENQRKEMIDFQRKNMDDFKNLLVTAVGKDKA